MLGPTQKLHLPWLAFISLEGTVHVTQGGKMPTVFSSCELRAGITIGQTRQVHCGNSNMNLSPRSNPYLPPLLGQVPVARQVVDPRGELTTVFLLNEYRIKVTSKDLSLSLALLNLHQRGFFIQQMVIDTKVYNWSRWKDGMVISKRGLCIISLLYRLKDGFRRGDVERL